MANEGRKRENFVVIFAKICAVSENLTQVRTVLEYNAMKWEISIKIITWEALLELAAF